MKERSVGSFFATDLIFQENQNNKIMAVNINEEKIMKDAGMVFSDSSN